MNARHLLCVSFAVVLFSSFSISANAKVCRLGEIVSLSGSGFLERNAQQVGLATGMLLCANDKIITGPDSVAEFELRDGGTKITVGKDSEFVIKKCEITRQFNVALLELVKGAFRVVTGRITNRPHRFEIKTAVAIIGVRGTDFWGGYGLTENGLDVLMVDGKGVYVKNNQGETVELDQPGLGTTVLESTPPSPPKKWDDAKVAEAIATVTP